MTIPQGLRRSLRLTLPWKGDQTDRQQDDGEGRFAVTLDAGHARTSLPFRSIR